MKLHENYQVLSAIQPSGDMHLGNYFGAIKNWVDLQEKYNCIYGIVDLHVLTLPYQPVELRKNTEKMMLELLACGIDPSRSILFIQSLVPEHTELSWILSCTTSYGQLTRMTQFKDKSTDQDQAKEGFVSAGLFTYPILQAADILIYNAKLVPVGQDQKQHLELTRNIAERFNNQFGEYFHLPEPLFTKTPKIMSMADPTRKMSKSLGPKHYIGLFEEEKSIRKKIRSAVTDTGDTQGGEMSPGVANLFQLLDAAGENDMVKDFTEHFENGTLRYGDLKGAVADVVVGLTNTLKERKQELEETLKHEGLLDQKIEEMSEKARAIARETIDEVRDLVGIRNVHHF